MSFARPAGPRVDVAPFRLSGVVYAVLLNHRRSLAALGDAVDAPPYKGAPRAVVLALKPRSSLVDAGGCIDVDDARQELQVAAALGVVIGRTACAVAAGDALAHVAGYLGVADATLPHASHYRPQLRAMARDGSCMLGDAVVPRAAVGDPDALSMRVFVDNELRLASSTAEHVRSTARLIAEISEFITLRPGDVVLAGSAPDGPLVRAGARVRIEIEQVGKVEATLRVATAAGAAA